MRTILVLILAAFLPLDALAADPVDVRKEPVELTTARVAYEKKAAAAKAEYDAAVKKLRGEYVQQLKEIQGELTKKGDLDGALMMRKAWEEVGNGEQATKKAEPALPQGKWEVLYDSEKRSIIFIDRTNVLNSGMVVGTIKMAPNSSYIVNQRINGHTERWTAMTDGRISVEYFMPNTTIPSNVGIMTKLKE